jgi:hypothetical protein
MTIQIDTREHKAEAERIERQFDAMGVAHFRSKLYCGDYQSLDNGRLVIDRKKDLQELCGNVTQQHERFRRELVRAKEAGIRIIVLCEHGNGIERLTDVYFWENPRLTKMKWVVENGRPKMVQAYPNAITGEKLMKILQTISAKYDVQFMFCDPASTGPTIATLLGGDSGG